MLLRTFIGNEKPAGVGSTRSFGKPATVRLAEHTSMCKVADGNRGSQGAFQGGPVCRIENTVDPEDRGRNLAAGIDRSVSKFESDYYSSSNVRMRGKR